MKLKVIKQTGEPINFLDSAMRNFFRIVYMVPVLHILEAGLVIMSKNYMRIGDFAANTIVVKIKNNEELVTVDSILEKTIVKDEMDIDSVNIYPLNNFEYRVLKEFLARKNNLGSRRPVFAYNLNLYFMKKFNVEKTYSNPYDFFEDIIKMNSGI